MSIFGNSNPNIVSNFGDASAESYTNSRWVRNDYEMELAKNGDFIREELNKMSLSIQPTNNPFFGIERVKDCKNLIRQMMEISEYLGSYQKCIQIQAKYSNIVNIGYPNGGEYSGKFTIQIPLNRDNFTLTISVDDANLMNYELPYTAKEILIDMANNLPSQLIYALNEIMRGGF